MGCASSAQQSQVVVTTTHRQTGQTVQVYPRPYQPAAKPIVVKNIPDAPKAANSRKSSSSSSSSDESVDLDKQRKQMKAASAMAAAAKEKDDAPKREVKITVETYHQYIALNAVIRPLERKNIVQELEEKVRLSIELKNQAVQMNGEYKQLQMKTQKELQDVQNMQKLASGQSVNIQKFFESQVQFDAQMSKEQEEYIQAKTEMEDCYKKLLAIQIRQSKLEVEIQSLRVDNEELMKHYKEQDDILEGMFGGSYGSELEDRLEAELDKKQEKKQRIEMTMHRWRNSQIMVQSAYQQLAYAFDRWNSLLRIPWNNSTMYLRMQATSAARAYLMAASQNLTNAHRTLATVTFPYCTRAEVETLNKAITYIYMDAMNQGRHSHAGNVYGTTRDRCFVLSQWITQVLTTVVHKDLDQSRKECAEVQTQLRAERTRLMREKIEAETGEKIEADDTADSGIETDEEPEPTEIAAEAENVPETQDLDKQIKEAQEGEEGGEQPPPAEEKPAAVPLDELAPAPNTKELFGNLETVMAEYDKQREDYAKEMEANRAKQQADFQMKLQARRSRKRRMMAQQQELNDLMKKEQETAAVEVPTET